MGLVPRGPHTHRMPRGSPDGAPSPSARCRGCGSQGQLPPDPRAPPRRAAARLSRGPLHHQDAPECLRPAPPEAGSRGRCGGETRSQPAAGSSEPHFLRAGRGEAQSISCCAAETSGDVIAFILPRVSAARAKVQPRAGRAARGQGQGSPRPHALPAPGSGTAGAAT